MVPGDQVSYSQIVSLLLEGGASCTSRTGTVQYSIVQCSTVQYSIVQYSAEQYSTWYRAPSQDSATPGRCQWQQQRDGDVGQEGRQLEG